MANSSAAVRGLSGGYISVAVAALILFFLPWVKLSCAGTEIFQQSGLQIAAGEVSMNEELSDKLGGAPKSVTPRKSGAGDADRKKARDQIEKSTPMWFFPAGLALVIVFGLVPLATGGNHRPMLPFVGGAAAFTMMVTYLVTEFPMEKKFQELQTNRKAPNLQPKSPEAAVGKMMTEGISVKRTENFTFEVVLTSVMFLLVCVHYGVAVSAQKEASPASTADSVPPED